MTPTSIGSNTPDSQTRRTGNTCRPATADTPRHAPFRPLWALWLAALPAVALAASDQRPSQQAIPALGDPFTARIASIDPDWQITFDCGDTQRVLPAGELAWWGTFRQPSHAQQLILADGGLLVAEPLQWHLETLTADSDRLGLIRLPLEALAGAVLLPPAEPYQRDLLLDRIASAAGSSDQVFLANDDELTGRIESMDEDSLRLATDVGPVDIPRHRVRAVLFAPTLRQRTKRPPLSAIAGLTDGSRLMAHRLLTQGDSLTITLAGGTPLQTTVQELAALEPLGGAVTYLSDLKPAGFRHVPYLDLAWPYRADRNVTGGMLRAAGRLYLKGLGVHSASRLSYQLDGSYQRFEADVAIDDSAGRGGSVHFAVYLDGKPAFTSPVIRGGMNPQPVSVHTAGAKRLDLIVDFADRADVLDRADWLAARLIRQPPEQPSSKVAR